MRLITRLSAVLGTAAVFTMSLAGVGNVASAHSSVAALAATCDPAFGADVSAAASALSDAATTTAADKLSAVSLTLIKLRYKYEDTAAPAGCEAAQQFALKRLSLYEDGAFFTLGAILDTKNTSSYTDIIKVWTARVKTATDAATATAPAAATMAATSAATGACPDANYVKQVFTDAAVLFGASDTTDPVALGAATLALVNLRYKYEDATAPAGCQLGAKHFIQLTALAEDSAIMSLVQLGDKANAAAYADFNKTVITVRGNALSPALSVDFPQSTAPAATAAATASK
jgi:hypothetical protein